MAQKLIKLRSIYYLLSLSPKHFSGRLELLNSEKHHFAVYFKQDLLRFSSYLMPYIHQGTIELVKVADLANPLMAKPKTGQKQRAIAKQNQARKGGIDPLPKNLQL